MRKLIFLLFGLLFFSLGCDDGSVGGGGRIKVVATLQTPLSPGIGANAEHNYFYFTCGGPLISYYGNQTTTPSPLTFSSDEIAVTQGANFSVLAVLVNTKDLGCQQVKFETFLNGTLFDTRTYNLGVISISPGLLYCDGVFQLSYNLIIP